MSVEASNSSFSANDMNHTIVHIGAGEGNDIEEQLTVNPKKLILIEPNPDIAAYLREKTRGWINVQVHEIAVTASVKEEQLVTLHEYNWNSASSLLDAAQLAQLYPGLQLVRNHQVKALSPAALIERLVLDKEENNTLIIEAPAVEMGIIEALCDSGQIEVFSVLTLRCPITGLYTDGTNPMKTVSRLEEYGFEMVEQVESDPDWPVYTLRRNRWRYSYQQSVKKLNMIEIQLSVLQEEKLSLDQALTERDRELSEKTKLIAERKEQLEQLVQARDVQTQLVAKHQAELEQLKAEMTQKSSCVIELEGKVSQLTTAHNEQRRLAIEREAQIEKMTAARESEAKLRAELESQLAELQQRQTLMAEQMYRAEGQIDLITDVLLREPGL